MAFFKKKKQTEPKEFLFLDPELDIEAEFRKRETTEKHEKIFYDIEQLQYVRTQCEQIAESSRYISSLKEEYTLVNEALSDVQVIESSSDSLRQEIRQTAGTILKLEDRRRKYMEHDSKLSRTKFQRFEDHEEEFPKALTSLQNDEKYSQAVKHDLRVLEAEKLSLKEDLENYGSRRTNIKNISIISLIGILAVFIIFILSGQLSGENGRLLFMTVLGLVAFYVFLIYFIQRNAVYMIKRTEQKIARAVTLSNKTKIKYVNVVNSVDYQLAKYNVKNSFQLSKEYQAYLEEKMNMSKLKQSTTDLDEAVKSLNAMLNTLNLYDTGIWNSKIEELLDPKEMIAYRQDLNIRRQKLRSQIDYNMERIEEAKKAVTSFVTRHPDKSSDVMEIVDSFEVEV